MKLYLALFTTLTLCWINPLDARPLDPEKTRHFSVCCVTILPTKYTMYYPESPLPNPASEYRGKWKQINLNTYNTDGPFSVKQGESLSFYERPDPSSRKLANVQFKNSIEHPLLCFSGNQNEQTYQVFQIDNQSVKQGAFHISNFTPSTMYLKIGETRSVIKPKASQTVKPKHGAHLAHVYVGSPNKEKKLIRSSKWYIDEHLREFIIFYGKPVRWKHIVDNKLKSQTR